MALTFPAWTGRFFTSEPSGSPLLSTSAIIGSPNNCGFPSGSGGKARRRQLVNLTEGLIRSWGLGTERQGPQERRADDGTSRIAPSVVETEMPTLCLSPWLLLPDSSPSRQERFQAGGQHSAGSRRNQSCQQKRTEWHRHLHRTRLLLEFGSALSSRLLLLLSRCSRVRVCAAPETAAHRLLRPWGSPGKDSGVGHHAFSTLTGYRVLNVITADHRISEPRFHLRLVPLPLRPSFKNLLPGILASASPSYPRKMQEKGQLDHPTPHKL